MAISNGMNKKNSRREAEKKILPFFIEFVKFCIAFAVIVAAALLALHVVSAQM